MENLFTFVKENAHQDTDKLRLKLKQKNFDFNLDFALTQIECRKRFSTKLRKFLENSSFLFPDVVSGEQCSHPAVARFHASQIPPHTKSILDMTAGLGIDAMELAKVAKKVTAIDLNKTKAEILVHNAKSLNINNLDVFIADSIEFLKDPVLHLKFSQQLSGYPYNDPIDIDTIPKVYDVIFIDPARRDGSNHRVYNLRDCSPDVIENIGLLRSKAKKVFIKASPLLDITQTIKDFPDVKSICTVGVKGECKEILIELDGLKINQDNGIINEENSDSYPSKNILLEAINLDSEGNVLSRFSFQSQFPFPSNSVISYVETENEFRPGTFILEPSAMMMKLSPWEEICETFKAKKFSSSSNLFITNELSANFPGRVTKFEKIITKKDRKSLMGLPASVVTRNYPLSSEELRKSLKLKEGDSNFIYASRVGKHPLVLLSKAEPC